ncbi:MAG: GNAT family N-acetyltransferase [Acidimicrobiales bacterium]
MNEVVDRPELHRLEVIVHGQLAELRYQEDNGSLVLVHTEVPDALGGHGIGGTLVRAAVERARRDGMSVVPRCPFAARWLRQHADELNGVAVDWKAARSWTHRAR